MSRRQAVASYMMALDALSPLAILSRGYSVIQAIPSGRIVRLASEVAVGDVVQARLAEGRLLCRVNEVLPPSMP
jgi:exodeoxyribonuclease VII large subunit